MTGAREKRGDQWSGDEREMNGVQCDRREDQEEGQQEEEERRRREGEEREEGRRRRKKMTERVMINQQIEVILTIE